MNWPVNLPILIAAVLALAVLIAMASLILRQRRSDRPTRSRRWRLALLLAAQPILAVLLYLSLLPPPLRTQAGTMVVATAGAAQSGIAAAGDVQIGLPEAPPSTERERAPDLATALRRHPDTQRVRVIGAGLEARDRDAARGLAIEFQPPALPRGLIGVWAPSRVGVGATFAIHGRVQGLQDGAVELLDPGRQRVDRVAPDRDGSFALSAVARGAGLTGFTVRLRDARQSVIEDIEVPVSVLPDAQPKVLLLAGAPGPELKYLRRWAADAGLKLHTQISVGAGMQLGDAPVALNAATLAGFDLVVLDERAWDALSGAQRDALTTAMRAGLGVMLRIAGPLSPRTRTQLRELGFELGVGADSVAMRLPAPSIDEDAIRARLGPGSEQSPRPRDQPVAAVPPLTRRNLSLAGPQVQSLLRDADGNAFAAWRANGQGRIGLWSLGDSFVLALAGRDDVHAQLWSQAFATLARAKPRDVLRIEGVARQGERMVLCGLADGAQVSDPRNTSLSLLIDPMRGAERCAAFWPEAAGWHALKQGERTTAFFVRGRDDAPGLRANELREATLALVSSRSRGDDAGADVPERDRWENFFASDLPRGAAWPWFLAWLVCAAGLWWLERSRFGRFGAGGDVAQG
ncbi:MAG: carboxypeptidase regulatory-like domain-containing protein [Lysobacter sp.]|nr:carboxypeptidase regulatory-like domain-containing protein [Lysobacter sp.]